MAYPLFFLVAFVILAPAGEPLRPLRPLRAETPPVLDGVLDDLVWQSAPHETGFKTWHPDFGIDMKENTVVYYAYDRENLYFAYRCYDSRPDLIKASISGRDTIEADDWVCLNLDTFNDQQSLYALYVNPLGIQGDSRFEGGQEDFTVDVVWYSGGKIDAEGYAVEIRIPFKSIRFSHKEPVEMGVIFERRISRLSQGGTYPPLDPAQGFNFLTQTRPLFLEDVKHYTLFEVLPAVTYSQDSDLEEGTLRSRKGKGDISLTGKYGITSQLIFDGTYNPDFSQVESDAGQVDFNLRYALFYPEKRPFFLEGREKFNFAAGSETDPLSAVVHTRTIVDPRLGLKLNGKLGPRDTIAFIYAMDELPGGAGEDFANFSIVRYKRALTKDSFLGGFYTGRFQGPKFNAVIGTDGQVRLTRASTLSYHLFLSQTKPQDEADKLNGHALAVQYSYSTRNAIFNLSLQDLGKNFLTETGYLTRNGITRLRAGFLPMIYPKSKVLLRIDPVIHSTQIHDKSSGLYETENSFDLRLLFPGNTRVQFGARHATEVFLGEKFSRNRIQTYATGQFSKQLSALLLVTNGRKIRYISGPYQGKGTDIYSTLNFLPSEKLHLDFEFTYSDFFRASDSTKEYDYTIVRGVNTYQVNKFLFFRAILEQNSFRKRLVTDFLASFTYIPGTVIHIGYGSSYEKIQWRDGEYVPSDRFLETKRGFFFKASYLWRL